ncbi:FAD/NAD(P)-binding domain-containing protein [Daedalea quercina L-15889]|uniref:FAD/NAD(P)-binding domain-containing protein n=1 Tax=Daedalea quercina L-15889 TaxID=1314783 RepID=A0A165QHU0_9APHY|nr:FAD/NAD(P)-binding domain-containing protein [Daedalea quercina L-15889]
MAHSPENFDILVVGGGPAGCATTLSIAKHDSNSRLRVLIVDDADPTAYKIGESLPAVAKRTLALLHPSLATRLAHDTSKGMHSVCTGNASAWASSELHETYALMNPYGAGWHLDRTRFDETLRETCGSMLRKGRFVAVRRVDQDAANANGHGWEVDADMASSGTVETFRVRWIIDATGRKASVARKIGAKTRKHSDLLSFYIVFRNLLTDDPDPGTAEETTAGTGDIDGRTLIEAAPSGWWYTARLPHSKRLVMYTTSPSDPTARVARTTTGFLDMLHCQTQHIVRTLHGPASASADSLDELRVAYEPESPTAKFTRCTAAGSAVLEPYAGWEPFQEAVTSEEPDWTHGGRGWCAVGDAALAFDPLSSQGIITSLNAGAFLGSVLAQHLVGDGLDGGSLVREIAKAYEQVYLKYEEGRTYYYDVNRRDV